MIYALDNREESSRHTCMIAVFHAETPGKCKTMGMEKKPTAISKEKANVQWKKRWEELRKTGIEKEDQKKKKGINLRFERKSKPSVC